MTGAAGDGHRRGPAGRRGLAWLIDAAAAGTPEPGRGSNWTSAAVAPVTAASTIRLTAKACAMPPPGAPKNTTPIT
jgi:hypothetical protein